MFITDDEPGLWCELDSSPDCTGDAELCVRDGGLLLDVCRACLADYLDD